MSPPLPLRLLCQPRLRTLVACLGGCVGVRGYGVGDDCDAALRDVGAHGEDEGGVLGLAAGGECGEGGGGEVRVGAVQDRGEAELD